MKPLEIPVMTTEPKNKFTPAIVVNQDACAKWMQDAWIRLNGKQMKMEEILAQAEAVGKSLVETHPRSTIPRSVMTHLHQAVSLGVLDEENEENFRKEIFNAMVKGQRAEIKASRTEE